MEWSMFMENELVIITSRLLLAAILGGLVGIEREFHHHPAGFRTHLLVSVGSSLIMLLAFYGFQDYIAENQDVVTFDPSRLAAYVVSGIGFLGAGTILVQGYTVRGLTTAASIWVVAAIGLTVGAGMYVAAMVATIIVILSLLFLGRITFRFGMQQERNKITIVVEEETAELNKVMRIFEEQEMFPKGIKSKKKTASDGNPMVEYQLIIEYKEESGMNKVIDKLHRIPFVKKIRVEKNSHETW
ncbi:MgtC/SapB family protein [Salipaludibacillus sp. HK11]|uniref:MgtC/SapB family protein n=1 Tax=Salipaludibacillus sp. HK11 TaxID=3394320 RepID=UPI0039FCD19E